jgi:hypothetical protein
MAQFLKPSNLNNVWASGGDRIYPGDTKYATGWQVEIPPRQYFNEIDYKQDQMLAHLNQHGIPVWDSETEYQADRSYVQGSTGTVYRCVQTHTAQNPDLDTNNDYWIIAFASAGDFYTATESDARYARISNNGSEYNPATFRTNLSVYSKAETYTKTEVDGKTTIASAAQSQALTSNNVLLTPQRLADAFLGANRQTAALGFQKFPGGFTVQWGTVTLGGSTSTSVTFATAFDNICRIGLAGFGSATGSNADSAYTTNLTSTGMTVGITSDNTNNTVHWVAIGY